MEINGMSKEHLNALTEAISSYEKKASQKELEKLKTVQKFANFINEHISS